MPRELEFRLGFSVLELSSRVATALAGGGGVVAPLPEKEDPGVEEPDPIGNPERVEAVLAIGRRWVPVSLGAPAGLRVSTART